MKEKMQKDKNDMMKKGKVKRYICNSVWVTLIGFATLVIVSIWWVLNKWQHLSMEEVVYQLKSPLQGTSTDIIWEYIRVCIPFVLAIIGGCIIFILLKEKIIKYKIFKRVITFGVVLAVITSMVRFWTRLDISAFIKNQTNYSTFIDDNYVNPDFVTLTFPEEKRNLIYIFLESMEITYADCGSGGNFDVNVIPELTELVQQYESFGGTDTVVNGGYPMTGATWTAGAMFAQTSGLPLNLPIGNDDMYTQDTFLPKVVTLGDILEEAGYEQTLLIGSYALFSGRDKYFSQHGNYNICDYAYSVANGEIPEDYYVWWGYEDEKLFENAKKRLLELSSQDKPFNLTMLTADTHFEDGYYCDKCETEFGNDQYANVFACSSRQVYEFVKWIQAQDFYENTTIVISGDHLTMDSDFCNDVDSDYVRKVYTCYINAPCETETDEKREYTTFDNFPTTLASLGVKIEGERLGLGSNLFSSELTLAEQYGYEVMEQNVAQKSRLIDEIVEDVDVEKNQEVKEKQS